jgi:addiction module RelE/StbE family toxin
MKNQYKLKITRAAAEDLDSIYKYISEELASPQSAEALMSEIEASSMQLKDFPDKCEYSRNERLRSSGYRRLVIKNYIGLYLVDEEKQEVVIARFFYGAMDYGKYI